MKHVVNFSGGLCSFWAAYRVAHKFGTENLTLLFADVLIESPDLYEFNAKASEIIGVPITRVCVGLTPWQLFRKEGMIANARYPICSVRLKREPLDLWHRQNCLEMDTTIYLGFDFSEHNRLEDIRAAKPEWHIEAPMCWEPLWDKCRMRIEAEKLGLPKQEAYEQGFPHNNCGKRCVRAGISHFVHLYHVDRTAYEDWEQEEQTTQSELAARGISNSHFSILKDRRNGETKSMTLKELRLRIESGEKFPQHDWGGCGCGGEAIHA